MGPPRVDGVCFVIVTSVPLRAASIPCFRASSAWSGCMSIAVADPRDPDLRLL